MSRPLRVSQVHLVPFVHSEFGFIVVSNVGITKQTCHTFMRGEKASGVF